MSKFFLTKLKCNFPKLATMDFMDFFWGSICFKHFNLWNTFNFCNYLQPVKILNKQRISSVSHWWREHGRGSLKIWSVCVCVCVCMCVVCVLEGLGSIKEGIMGATRIWKNLSNTYTTTFRLKNVILLPSQRPYLSKNKHKPQTSPSFSNVVL